MEPVFLVVNALILLMLSLAWRADTGLNLIIKGALIALFLTNVLALLQVSGYLVHR